eukprot:Rmarinus@m.25285
MFSLLWGLFEYLFRKAEYHVLILGVDAAGKTTILEKLKNIFTGKGLDPSKIPPTVGQNIGRLTVDGCTVIFWDLGGQSGLRSLWQNYYAEAHALIYVIDAADESRFDESKSVFDDLLERDDLRDVPVLIFSNKQDKKDAASEETISRTLLRKQSRAYRLQPSCALNGQGLREGLHWLITYLKDHARDLDS